MTKIYTMGKRDKEAERTFHGNQHVKVGFVRKTIARIKKFVSWFTIWTIRVAGIALLVATFAEVYRLYMTDEIVHTVEAEQSEKLVVPKILEKIADCESGKRLPSGRAIKGSASHYGASGQVLMTGNTNKSVDVGKFAINSVWFKEAKRLGLDLTNEEDNTKMALWIYENRGTQDWNASSKCWQ